MTGRRPRSLREHPLVVNSIRAAILALLGVGLEVGVRSGALDPVFFSSPSAIYKAFIVQLGAGTLLRHTWTTLYEVALGFSAGAVIGMFCGLVLSRLRFVAEITVPFFMMVYGLPSIVLAPLFILWFGIGVLSKIAISIYVIFFSVFIAVYIGALQVERELIDAVRAMGATPRQIFWKVVVPATASNIYAALKLGVGLALISAIAGEFIAARAGLGYMIFFATGVLDTPTLYLGIIVLALFSVALQGGVNVLGRALVRWRFHDEK